MDSLSVSDIAGAESWRGVPHSPSHESVTTDLSLFSVSSAASDAKILRLLACKAGQGPDPSLRGASPNPDARSLSRRPTSSLLRSADSCRSLLCGCAALCAALGLRRSFSAGDVQRPPPPDAPALRNAESVVCLLAALAPPPRSSSARADPPSPLPPRPAPGPPHSERHEFASANNKVRQSYIRRRLLSTYRALERMSQSEFNLDKLEAAAVSAAPCLLVPSGSGKQLCKLVHPEAVGLALASGELDRARGRPLSKYERNMMIFNWLHTLDDCPPEEK